MKTAIDKIIISKDNPRQSFDEEGLRRLGESIKTHGQLQPIIVRPKGSFYELVVGERRLRASALVGINEIEARVEDLDDATCMELRLIENCHREDLTDAEKGDAVYALWALGKFETIKQIAEAINKSYKTVLKWTEQSRKLSPRVKELVYRGTLSSYYVRRLLKYPHTTQERLAKVIGKIPALKLTEFIKMYDANPKADLDELVNKVLGIEKVEIPESMLTEEQKRKLEEKRELAKVRRIPKKPSKPLTKEEIRKRQKKMDFKFVKAKVTQGKAGSAPMLKAEIKPTVVPIPSGPDYSLCKCAVCPLFGSHCKGRCWQ